MPNQKFNIILFSLSAAISDIAAIIQNNQNGLPYLCLSSHDLFDLEREELQRVSEVPLYFTNFGDFLTDEELAWCDTNAYELEVKEKPVRERSRKSYFQRIKSEKNKLILKKLKEQYQLAEKYLCADDLGIAADVWLEEGFRNQMRAGVIPTAHVIPTKEESPVSKNPLKRLSGVYQNFVRMQDKMFLLQTPVGNYIFLGSVTRMQPHFDTEVNVLPLRPDLTGLLSIFSLLFLSPLSAPLGRSLWYRLQRKQIAKLVATHNVKGLLSSMHEDKPVHPEFAADLNMDLNIFQDGFLPENYTSRYLHYYVGTKKFWTWDRLSLGIFKNQELPAEVCPFLTRPKLPMIEKETYPIQTILVLTSGSGDWTALKNRSDEDQMLMAFVKVAEHFPEIQIIYRCHPVWAHPEYQGLNSIERADQYLRDKKLPNIAISSQSLVQSEKFKDDNVVGFPKSSLDEDIKKADLVFGEHSFTMITAARRGILFASVNITQRRDFFHNYSRLGFPHLKSAEEIVAFIEQLGHEPEQILKDYNQAVQSYNDEWLIGMNFD